MSYGDLFPDKLHKMYAIPETIWQQGSVARPALLPSFGENSVNKDRDPKECLAAAAFRQEPALPMGRVIPN